MNPCEDGKWLLLIHQIPPKPAYFRVKIWRRLLGVGAVAIKNSVYVIPRNEDTLETFQWLRREIVQGGGDASICVAAFIDGLTDAQVEALFREARDAEYALISEEVRHVLQSIPSDPATAGDDDANAPAAAYHRLDKRFRSVEARDFFGAPGRDSAREGLNRIARVMNDLRSSLAETRTLKDADFLELRGMTWVTRKGIYVDRIASAWLIRRFIDPDAKFRFVTSTGYRPRTREVRFDMFEGEFTHEGDMCTFEVLVSRFLGQDEALVQIGRIIHDLDLKDGKFNRPETPGIGALLEGLASSRRERNRPGGLAARTCRASAGGTPAPPSARRTRPGTPCRQA